MQRQNHICSGTRNQWSWRRSGMKCTEHLAEYTGLAAALRTDWNLLRRWPETPASNEQQQPTLLTKRARISVSEACFQRHRRMLHSCRSAEKHNLTAAITCVRMVTYESMYTPRSPTEKTDSMSVVPIRNDVIGIWCWQWQDEHHKTLVLDGFACSHLALIHDNTSSLQADIRSQRYHMVDKKPQIWVSSANAWGTSWWHLISCICNIQ